MATEKQARAVLEANKRAAARLVDDAGVARTQAILKRSAADLEKRLAAIPPALGEDTYTVVQMRAALAQVRHVLVETTIPGLEGVVLRQAEEAARVSAQQTVDYLRVADQAFRGVGEQPLALDAAAMLEQGVRGAKASVLRRLAEGSSPKAKKAKVGILSRYGIETVKNFEQTLQVGLIAKKSQRQMVEDITAESPFLQGAPKYWAHRIVRTETMNAHNSAANHSIVQASKTLTGMLKIISETFDDRTGEDSFATHGMIRRPDEQFDSWYGPFDCPPDRPNDRGIVVPHRIRWPIPEYLEPKTDDEIAEAWAAAKRKGEPPERPVISTVPGFGLDDE